MKVKQLIQKLSALNDDVTVVLSRDEEGNGYGELRDLSFQIYADGEIYASVLTPALRLQGYTEEDVYHGDDGIHVVVLWP